MQRPARSLRAEMVSRTVVLEVRRAARAKEGRARIAEDLDVPGLQGSDLAKDMAGSQELSLIHI